MGYTHPFLWEIIMSFTVFDGVKIENVSSIIEAFDFLVSFKQGMKDIVQEDKARTILTISCLLYDQYHVSGVDAFEAHDTKRIPLLTAMHRLDAVDKEQNTEYNIGLREIGKYIVAVPFLKDKVSYKLFMDDPRVTPWGYWDNVDPDETASKKEWKLREKVWNEVFEGDGIPAESLLMVRMFDTKYVIPEDKFMQTLPTVEERETALANTLGMDAEYRESEALNENLLPSAAWARTQILAKEILPTIQGKLNADLTLHNLEQTTPIKQQTVPK